MQVIVLNFHTRLPLPVSRINIYWLLSATILIYGFVHIADIAETRKFLLILGKPH